MTDAAQLPEGLPAALTRKPPWSASQLRKLGKCLRDGQPIGPGAPSYEDVIVWYDELATAVQAALREIDWLGAFGGQDRSVEITSRAKTLDTLRDKLVRHPTHPLSNIQDIAGVRLEAEMSLSEQWAIASAIAGKFGATDDALKDIRTDAHSGYRAVHVWLRLPAGHVEVQVRTHMQGRWANAYEAAADVLGREIRYGELPSDPDEALFVQRLQALSTENVAQVEALRDMLFRIEYADPEDIAAMSIAVPAALSPDWEGPRTLEGIKDRLRSESHDLEETYTLVFKEVEDGFRMMPTNGEESDV